MKDKHKSWLNLTSQTVFTPSAPANQIVIRELEGIQRIETAILMQDWRINKEPIGGFDLLNSISEALFGVTDADAQYIYPDEYHTLPNGDPVRKLYKEEQMAHDASFETNALMDDEIVDYFLPKGIDFRDENGKPLRCTLFLARVVELVLEGELGHWPDMAKMELDKFQSGLAKEASEFVRKKRSRN